MLPTPVTEQTITEGYDALGQLARAEYDRGLPEVLQSLSDEHGPSRLYFGRLLGIIVKEPFSQLQTVPELAGAKRRWELVPQRLQEERAQTTWQFQLLAQLQTESLEYSEETYRSVQEMAEEVKRETGFFWHLLRSLRKYILC